MYTLRNPFQIEMGPTERVWSCFDSGQTVSPGSVGSFHTTAGKLSFRNSTSKGLMTISFDLVLGVLFIENLDNLALASSDLGENPCPLRFRLSADHSWGALVVFHSISVLVPTGSKPIKTRMQRLPQYFVSQDPAEVSAVTLVRADLPYLASLLLSPPFTRQTIYTQTA